MNNYKPKNFLITGGAGFIGSHFIRYLLNTYPDIQIVNYDNLTYAGTLKNLADVSSHKNYHFIKADICDQKKIEEVLIDFEIETIVHFAAESHVDQSIASPSKFIHTNIVGTHNLLESAAHYWLKNKKMTPYECRFHHISTDEVYGSLSIEDEAFTETTPYAPNSPYSASKASSDHLVRAYFQTFNLPITISNCSNNFGSYQHFEKFIPTIIRSCLHSKPIPVYGNGTNIRDWLYVIDHCHAVDLIIRKGFIGETYNLGGNNEISNIELVQKICKMMDEVKPQKNKHENLITFIKDRPGHDLRYATNSNKITHHLGWQPQNDFSTTLSETVYWYLENYDE